jgi:hypothetical protein
MCCRKLDTVSTKIRLSNYKRTCDLPSPDELNIM